MSDDATFGEKGYQWGWESRRRVIQVISFSTVACNTIGANFNFWWDPQINFFEIIRTYMLKLALARKRKTGDDHSRHLLSRSMKSYAGRRRRESKEKSRFIVSPLLSFEKVSSPISSDHRVWTGSCFVKLRTNVLSLCLSTSVVELSVFGQLNNRPSAIDSSSFVQDATRTPKETICPAMKLFHFRFGQRQKRTSR